MIVADGTVTITEPGRASARTLRETERAALRQIIDEWPGSQEPDVEELVEDIVSRLSREDQPPAGVLA